MKKKLCILLAITLITINLAACGKTEQQDVITLPPEVLQEAPHIVTPTTPSLDAESTVGPEVITEPEVPTATESLGEYIEIIPSDAPAAEGEFGSHAGFSGIYAIRGYTAFTFNEQRTLSLGVRGVNNKNSGTFDASNTSIPEYILDYKDYVYLNLVFDNSGLVSWSVIDKIDSIDLGQATIDVLENLTPDKRYEQIKMGELPSRILLSQYEPGKMYVFDMPANADQGYMSPDIFNDSECPVLIISTRVGLEHDFAEEWKCNPYMPKNAFSFGSCDNADDKYYLIIQESSVEAALNEVKYLKLSTCEIGAMIDFDFEDFLYNDTDTVFTLSCDDKTYTVAPGELMECSWMNDVMVDSIA